MRRLLFLLLISAPLFAATGDILAVRISGDSQRTDAAHCSIGTGTATLTCTGGLFVSNDARDHVPIKVTGAGAAAADLLTTISVFTDSQHVTLATNASTTVTNVTGFFGVARSGIEAEVDINNLAVGGTYSFGNINGPTGNLANAVFVLNVNSPGFDTSGNAATTSRVVYATQFGRVPYNDTTSTAPIRKGDGTFFTGTNGGSFVLADESVASTTLTVKVYLSQSIYVTDTVTAVTIASGFYTNGTPSNACASCVVVTNNSTLVAPQALFQWATIPGQVQTADFVIEGVAASAFPQNMKEVAAVIYSCSDTHAHTVTSTVNNMTISNQLPASTNGGDQNAVLVYAATIPVASFTDGDQITCNATAYPWVGTSYTSSGGTAFTDTLGPLQFTLNKAGAVPPGYLVVNSGTGSDAACPNAGASVYTSLALAEAGTILQTVNKAITCFKGARGNLENGFIALQTGNYSIPSGAIADQGAQNSWLTIMPDTGNSPVFNGGTGATLHVRKLKYQGLSITGAVALQIIGSGANDSLWLDNNAINLTGGTCTICGFNVAYGTRNTITAAASQNGFMYSGTRIGWYTIRGNVGPATSGDTVRAIGTAMFGNKNLVPVMVGVGQTSSFGDGSIVAYNTVLSYNGGNFGINGISSNIATTGVAITKGVAFLQNLAESGPSLSQELVCMACDASAQPVTNFISHHNTWAGERSNLLYNDGTSATGGCTQSVLMQSLSIIADINSNLNEKHDMFTTDACSTGQRQFRTGNWAAAFSVGLIGNVIAATTQQNYSNRFMPESNGLLGKLCTGTSPACAGVTLGYFDDRGFYTGSNRGQGDYHLRLASTQIGVIPCSLAGLPYDLDGKPRCINNATTIGVFEVGVGSKAINSKMVNAVAK